MPFLILSPRPFSHITSLYDSINNDINPRRIKQHDKFLHFTPPQSISPKISPPKSFTISNFIEIYGISSENLNQVSSITDYEETHNFDKRTSKLRIQKLVDRIRVLSVSQKPQLIQMHANELNKQSDLNDLLTALFITDEIEIAFNLFSNLSSCNNISPDCCSLSIIVKCYCKRNNPAEAKLLLDYMIENGFKPDIATFGVVINSFCQKGKLQQAFEVFDSMGKIGLKPNIQTYNCLMKGLCYVGRVEEAYELLMKLKNCYVNLDIYSYTVVMDGFCKVGRTMEAMELLNEALSCRLKPNVVTFNAVFNGYCKEGRPLEGISLLNRMKAHNCMPDSISYSTLLHGLLKWGEIQASLRVYKEMIQNGFDVDERMMNTMLRGVCRRSWKERVLLIDAYELFHEMKTGNVLIYQCAYGLFIQTLCIAKEINKAIVNLHDMIQVGYSPRMVTFNSVIRALCDEGRVSDALLVLIVAYESGRIPSRISYNLLISEFNRQGRFMSACNVYGAALKVRVIPDKKPLQIVKLTSLMYLRKPLKPLSGF